MVIWWWHSAVIKWNVFGPNKRFHERIKVNKIFIANPTQDKALLVESMIIIIWSRGWMFRPVTGCQGFVQCSSRYTYSLWHAAQWPLEICLQIFNCTRLNSEFICLVIPPTTPHKRPWAYFHYSTPNFILIAQRSRANELANSTGMGL